MAGREHNMKGGATAARRPRQPPVGPEIVIESFTAKRM